MKKVVIAASVGLAMTAYFAFSIHAISNQGAEALLVCADNGGLRIPFSRYVCREYLFSFRGSPQDIEQLHRGVGATFVVQGSTPLREREQVLKFLIGKGLDVNRIDMHGLSPLHSAVLSNSTDEVALLLRNGAASDLKDRVFGLTALELAIKLQRERRKPLDRGDVIAALRKAG